MTIFLDKQRPPLKKMGRKQRRGSKSNPRTGVQWANWLDDPSGAPGGGGGGVTPDAPVLITLTPSLMSVAAANAGGTVTITGTGFGPDAAADLSQIGGIGFSGSMETVSVTPTTVVVQFFTDYGWIAGSYNMTVFNYIGSEYSPNSNPLPFTITA